MKVYDETMIELWWGVSLRTPDGIGREWVTDNTAFNRPWIWKRLEQARLAVTEEIMAHNQDEDSTLPGDYDWRIERIYVTKPVLDIVTEGIEFRISGLARNPGKR